MLGSTQQQELALIVKFHIPSLLQEVTSLMVERFYVQLFRAQSYTL
jgi:hypothetical protein